MNSMELSNTAQRYIRKANHPYVVAINPVPRNFANGLLIMYTVDKSQYLPACLEDRVAFFDVDGSCLWDQIAATRR